MWKIIKRKKPRSSISTFICLGGSCLAWLAPSWVLRAVSSLGALASLACVLPSVASSLELQEEGKYMRDKLWGALEKLQGVCTFLHSLQGTFTLHACKLWSRTWLRWITFPWRIPAILVEKESSSWVICPVLTIFTDILLQPLKIDTSLITALESSFGTLYCKIFQFSVWKRPSVLLRTG